MEQEIRSELNRLVDQMQDICVQQARTATALELLCKRMDEGTPRCATNMEKIASHDRSIKSIKNRLWGAFLLLIGNAIAVIWQGWKQ